jgi:hypothetical protein
MIGAGRKNANNTFSGVIMGDWTGNVNKNDSTDSMAYQTGIYGFHEGETSFGFMENGTGFIGKADKGRIIFDGTNSVITSANWSAGAQKQGLYLDIDDGFLMTRNSDGQYIKLNSLAETDTIINSDFSYASITANPLPGKDQDGDYPFVVYGNENNYTAIGWNGNLLLHGSPGEGVSGVAIDDNGNIVEDKKNWNNGKVSGFISLNASAEFFPINVNNYFGI